MLFIVAKSVVTHKITPSSQDHRSNSLRFASFTLSDFVIGFWHSMKLNVIVWKSLAGGPAQPR